MMTKVRVGLIGCGGYTKGVDVPILQKNPKYEIRACMDIVEEAAKSLALEVGASYHTTDVEKMLTDDAIDAVFIATRHDTHAKYVILAANAKKHIKCEKPMAMNKDQVMAVAEAVMQNRVKYTVGYNRGLSPFIQKSKELLKEKTQKIMMYHRIHGLWPEDIWTHDPVVGGGRFVGEGCHIFDLICEVIDKKPISLYASGGTFLDPEKVTIPDSGMITITFEDGSVGSTLICSAGNNVFAKEATEIYCYGSAIHIENFEKMTYYGFEGQNQVSIAFDRVDKGQAVELDRFADAVLHNTESPNGIEQAARAAIISYKVNESIKTGQIIPIEESEYRFG